MEWCHHHQRMGRGSEKKKRKITSVQTRWNPTCSWKSAGMGMSTTLWSKQSTVYNSEGKEILMQTFVENFNFLTHIICVLLLSQYQIPPEGLMLTLYRPCVYVWMLQSGHKTVTSCKFSYLGFPRSTGQLFKFPFFLGGCWPQLAGLWRWSILGNPILLSNSKACAGFADTACAVCVVYNSGHCISSQTFSQ